MLAGQHGDRAATGVGFADKQALGRERGGTYRTTVTGYLDRRSLILRLRGGFPEPWQAGDVLRCRISALH